MGYMKSLVTKKDALEIWKSIKTPQDALDLFARASKVRDSNLGGKIWMTSGSGGIFPCSVFPRCRYCTFFSESTVDIPTIVLGVKKLQELGYRQFHISGGTNIDGNLETSLIRMVAALTSETKVGIEVNLGPSLSAQGVRELRNLGVESITSSLETFNPVIFNDAKPGDSLEKRIRLLQICDEENVSSRSMMLVGLGESIEDRVDQLFFLAGLEKLYQLRISRFHPFPNTEYSGKPACSPWDTAITTAIARLILPDREISLAAGNSEDDIPLWYLAGGGNQIMGGHFSALGRKEPVEKFGTSIHRIGELAFVSDSSAAKRRLITGLGLPEPVFSPVYNSTK